jgi:hypothetical protein
LIVLDPRKGNLQFFYFGFNIDFVILGCLIPVTLCRPISRCVLVVEILPQITNIYEYVNGEVVEALSLDHEIIPRRNNGLQSEYGVALV